MTSNQYLNAGVDITTANRIVDLIKTIANKTSTEGSGDGSFTILPGKQRLIASTDGVGTKTLLATQYNYHLHGIGHDIVNHCLNDILVRGARPLFFLDYIASDKLDPGNVVTIVSGMAEACQECDCALIGGELAEMPDVYTLGSHDVVGTMVGLVDSDSILPNPGVMLPGDFLFGLPSSGPHTNGYSLIRKIIADLDPRMRIENSTTLIDAAMAPHKSYFTTINRIRDAGIFVKGMSHITGGGFVGNLPRSLPQHLRAVINLANWNPPALFQHFVEWGKLTTEEAYQVFNMGVGMILIVGSEHITLLKHIIPEAFLIGQLTVRHKDTPQVELIE